jgi:hypothetical protein
VSVRNLDTTIKCLVNQNISSLLITHVFTSIVCDFMPDESLRTPAQCASSARLGALQANLISLLVDALGICYKLSRLLRKGTFLLDTPFNIRRLVLAPLLSAADALLISRALLARFVTLSILQSWAFLMFSALHHLHETLEAAQLPVCSWHHAIPSAYMKNICEGEIYGYHYGVWGCHRNESSSVTCA